MAFFRIDFLPSRRKSRANRQFLFVAKASKRTIFFFVDCCLPETENMLLFYQFYLAIFNADGPCFLHFFNQFSYMN